MKVLFITQDDPFYIPYFFKRFFEIYKLDENIDINGYVIQDALGNNSKIKLAKRMLGFYGLFNFTRYSFKYVFKKSLKKLYSIGIIKKVFLNEYYFKENNISLLEYKNVNKKDFQDYCKTNNIDLLISVSASQIFKKEILSIPTFGCINMHNAPLPYYRGMLPNFWQMLNGEKKTVLTIHKMVEDLDKGDIIYQADTEIKKGMSLDELIKLTKIKSADALLHVIKLFRDNKVEYKKLSSDKGSYFTFPKKADVKEFKKKGYKII